MTKERKEKIVRMIARLEELDKEREELLKQRQEMIKEDILLMENDVLYKYDYNEISKMYHTTYHNVRNVGVECGLSYRPTKSKRATPQDIYFSDLIEILDLLWKKNDDDTYKYRYADIAHKMGISEYVLQNNITKLDIGRQSYTNTKTIEVVYDSGEVIGEICTSNMCVHEKFNTLFIGTDNGVVSAIIPLASFVHVESTIRVSKYVNAKITIPKKIVLKREADLPFFSHFE